MTDGKPAACEENYHWEDGEGLYRPACFQAVSMVYR